MLKVLRNKSIQKNIYMFLAVAVVVSFVVSGVLISRDDKVTSGALAKIGKHPVTVHEYLDSYRAVERQASFMYGEKLNEVRSRINFKGEAWDRLLLLDYAKKQGIRVNDTEVVGWISSQESFKTKGKFDEKLYELYIERALRTTPRAFEEEIRQMLTLGKVQDSLKGDASALTDEKLKTLYQAEKVEKDLLSGTLPWENFKDQVPATDKDIEQLYAVVKDTLTVPEKPGEKLSLDEAREELKKIFTKNSAVQMAVAKLAGLKEKLKAGDFEAVLKAEGVETSRIEKYRAGVYPAGIYPSENLQNAVSTLKENEVSDAFEVPKGAMIVKVAKVYPFDEKKFEEEKETFKNEKTSKLMNEGMNGLLEKLRKDLTLDLERMKAIFPEDSKPS